MDERRKIIAVDFDGTLCMNEGVCDWPYLGPVNQELAVRLKKLQAEGAALILWTCREGESLEQAISWCNSHCKITFDAVNDNLPAIKSLFGGNSRKICCDYYIDNKGFTPEAFYNYLDE